jgi:hypothetical protein
MRTFQIDDPLFKTKPLFVVGCSFVELQRYMRKHFKVDVGLDADQAGQMFTFQTAPWRVVWVQHNPDSYPRVGCLLHEIFHLVTRICQDKGIPIKAQIEEGNGDETAAYLFDYFAREALRRTRFNLQGKSARKRDSKKGG